MYNWNNTITCKRQNVETQHKFENGKVQLRLNNQNNALPHPSQDLVFVNIWNLKDNRDVVFIRIYPNINDTFSQ